MVAGFGFVFLFFLAIDQDVYQTGGFPPVIHAMQQFPEDTRWLEQCVARCQLCLVTGCRRWAVWGAAASFHGHRSSIGHGPWWFPSPKNQGSCHMPPTPAPRHPVAWHFLPEVSCDSWSRLFPQYMRELHHLGSVPIVIRPGPRIRLPPRTGDLAWLGICGRGR